MSKQYDYSIKATIVGDTGTGKSNLLKRLSATFTYEWDNTPKPTIGVDYSLLYSSVDQCVVRLFIWDTSGESNFRKTNFLKLKGQHGFLVFYDITNRKTFENVVDWIKGAKEKASNDATIVLVGNKSDLEEDREVSYEEGRLLAEELGVKFIEISAKRNENIDYLAKWIMRQGIEKEKEKVRTEEIRLSPGKTFSSLTKCFST